MQTANSVEEEWKHPRGVFRTRYKIKGCWGLVAVDSRGEGVKRVLLRPGVDEKRATIWLRDWLDRVDPVPQLRLVKPNERAPMELPDPAQRDDRLSQARRIAQRGIGRLFRFE